MSKIRPCSIIRLGDLDSLGGLVHMGFVWHTTLEGFSYWFNLRKIWNSIEESEYVHYIMNVKIPPQGRILNDQEVEVLYLRFRILAVYRDRFNQDMPLDLVKAVLEA